MSETNEKLLNKKFNPTTPNKVLLRRNNNQE